MESNENTVEQSPKQENADSENAVALSSLLGYDVTEILLCNDCNKKPWLTETFMFYHGYAYECGCGVCIPFPPAVSEDKALQEWNKWQMQKVA